MLFLLSSLLIMVVVQNRCFNNTMFRYSLHQPVQITGYYSICQQITFRTCCSPNNIDTIAKKIIKILGNRQEISSRCWQMLENVLCSPCSSDIGQGYRQAICNNYCQQIHQVCKNDYFILDLNDNLRVCQNNDIICSKLFYIKMNQKNNICEMIGLQTKKQQCWNGISTLNNKKILQKISYNGKYKNKKNKNSNNNKIKQNQKIQTNYTSQRYIIYITFVSLAIIIVSWKWLKKHRELRRRQLRYL